MSDIGLFDAMYSARALRRLKTDPVPKEIITKILDAAIRAPSAGNSQHWVFVVVRDPDLRRGLRNFLGRTRHLASCVIRAGAVSAPDGQAGVSEPHCAGAGAFSRCASGRKKRLKFHHRCIDCVGADQCGADWRALVVMPKAVYRWLRTVVAARVFCPLCAALKEMARPSKVRANMLMAKRMRNMARGAPSGMALSSAKFAVRARTIISVALQTQPSVQ